MDRYEYLNRTKASWENMFEVFIREWMDGYETMKRQTNWHKGIFQVVDYYKAHAERMIQERWPWLKEVAE